MKPMLCKRYKKSYTVFPCYVQPKLDGVRALWLGDRLQSRSYGREEEKIFDERLLPHIHKILKEFPNTFFDGELYRHGWSRQKINSVARVTSVNPHPENEMLYYYIFDIIAPRPFYRRLEDLQGLNLSSPLFVVDTTYCHSEGFGDMLYRMHKQEGFEGSIYRDLNAKYGMEHECSNLENRWKCILKRKQRLDMDCEVVGVNLSEKFDAISVPHIASLQLRTDRGIVFSCGGGLSHEEKIRFVDDPPIGCVVAVSYDSLSDTFVPLQPAVEVIYV